MASLARLGTVGGMANAAGAALMPGSSVSWLEMIFATLAVAVVAIGRPMPVIRAAT